MCLCEKGYSRNMESGDCIPDDMCYDKGYDEGYDEKEDMYQYEVSSAGTQSIALLTITSCWLIFNL